MTRKERAIIIRDAILAWLPGRSTVEQIGDTRLAIASAGRFHISYRTPFTPWAALAPNTFQGAMLLQQRGGKVMNVEWEPSGLVELVSFRGGDWEAELLAIVAG